MYSIANVIYGVPLTDKIIEVMEKIDPDTEPEDFGFETCYHGGSTSAVGYCGVLLGEFDECAMPDELPLSKIEDFRQALTPELKQEGDKLVAELDEEIRKATATPDIYIVFSTS